jgi:hypothetical protein
MWPRSADRAAHAAFCWLSILAGIRVLFPIDGVWSQRETDIVQPVVDLVGKMMGA